MAIILSCLHSNARFIRGKSWKISLFPKPVGEIAKTSILPTTCFKQFLCSSRLASTFGKSLSSVFVASSNSGRNVESVIIAISHFSLWSKMLHCWQKLSKSTNQRERTFVKNSYKHSRTSLPSPPLLFISIFTSHPSPLSERLEQAKECRKMYRGQILKKSWLTGSLVLFVKCKLLCNQKWH